MQKINWLEWSKEAFDRAKQEDKPVLLDIHGVWCHWCHRMEEDTYSDELVIELINEKFIPVRVDTDKRPDINERYNQGGWPTTAFLTPDGAVIAGATYMPPAELATTLEQIANYYARNKNHFEFEIHENKPEKDEIKSVIDEVLAEAARSFDDEYGGFGVQPKFPFPDVIELAMLKYRAGDKGALTIATRTLDGILGLFDNVEGGFYRYSVTRSWDLPHYEKMLETNAQLIVNYVHAFHLTGDEKYREIALRTGEFLLTVLHGPDGFYGSQDADKEEEYYGKALVERQKMSQPYIDRTFYTNLNAIAISSFFTLGTLDKKYNLIALENLDNLIKNFYTDEGMCHYYDGKRNVFGLLTDNIYTIKALLDTYEIALTAGYLEKAQELMKFVIENFFDTCFFDKVKSDEDVGLLAVLNRSINDNAIAADCLIRLAFHTSDEHYMKIARGALESFSKDTKKYKMHAASYAIAVEKFLNGVEITVSNVKNAEPIVALHDPRLMIKLDNVSEGYNFYICNKQKCVRFKDFEEVKEFLVALK